MAVVIVFSPRTLKSAAGTAATALKSTKSIPNARLCFYPALEMAFVMISGEPTPKRAAGTVEIVLLRDMKTVIFMF